DLQQIKSVRLAYVLSATGAFGQMGLARAVSSRSSPALVYKDGALHEQPSGTAQERVFFPEPIGWKTVGLCRGAEAVLIPRALGNVGEVRVKNGVAEPALASLLRPAMVSRNGNGARSLWDRVIDSIPPIRPNSPAWSAARVDVAGESAGASESVAYGIADSLPNLLSATVLTAVRLMAGGSLRPGAVFPDQVFDPGAFFALLAQRGPRVARLTRFGDRPGPKSAAAG
ncbi:MAG: hypothetical protein ACRDIA_08310, partial [Actinomycetota bacterium]